MTLQDYTGGSKFKMVKTQFLICQITRLYSRIVKMYFFFNCSIWFSSYRPLKVKGTYCICTEVEKLSTSNFLDNGVKLFSYHHKKRKENSLYLSHAKVLIYNNFKLNLLAIITFDRNSGFESDEVHFKASNLFQTDIK